MGFDIIGSREGAVAVIHSDSKSRGHYREKAREIMSRHRNVKAVLRKNSERKGEYRLYDMKIVAGSKKTEVVHKEAGCFFKVDPMKAYFSTRESTERARIAKDVKEKETIMVFFAGVGPLPIVIGKKSKAARIIGIESNPEAVKYFVLNIVKNKLKNVEPVLGDVKKEAKNYYGECDRVLMPLPETAYNYLRDAIRCCGKRGTVSYYFFGTEEGAKKEKARISEEAEKEKRRVTAKKPVKVLPYGPGTWKHRIDFRVW